MVNENNNINQFKLESFVPKTYDQYVLEDSSVAEQANLYPELSYQDVSSQNGYGPCYVCEKPENWTFLKVSCPVSTCSDKTPGYWHHNKDGCRDNLMKIYSRGKIECGKCKVSHQIGCWLFVCSKHGGTPEYATKGSFKRALSIVLASDDCDEVITDLGAYIADPKHKNEWFS